MLRSDLWVAAFVRRHNDIGEICVLTRRGDPIAGQIFIAVDHLDGTETLLVPAPAVSRREGDEDRLFTRQLDHATPDAVRARIEREADFDPDLWVVSIETRKGDVGVTVAES
jgi:hypothetical protein